MAKGSVKEMESAEKERPPATTTRAPGPFEEFERMLESYFDRSWLRPMRWEFPLRERFGAVEARVPRVDVIDRDTDVLVRAEIPGVEKKDLDVSVTDNAATIKGQFSSESKEEKGDYYRCEISRGSFVRTVALPGEVEGDKAEARIKDGVLEITIPKMKQSRRRRIEVK